MNWICTLSFVLGALFSSLRLLCVLCVSADYWSERLFGTAENAEEAQRRKTKTKHKAQSTIHCVTIVPIFTTSKSAPLSVLSWFNSSSSQRISGAPLKYQLEPLSARIIPYFFIARRITCIAGVKPEMSKLDFNRTFTPMGGRLTLVLLLAQ